MLKNVAFGLLFLAGAFSYAEAQQSQQPSVENAIANLNWQVGAASHYLDVSEAYIHTKDDEAFLRGKDAHELMRLSEGHDAFKPDAVILKLDGPMADSIVTYQYSETGFLKMNDWEEYIDPSEILNVIIQNTEENNRVRVEGYPDIFIDGWIEEPHLDRDNAIVYWAIKGHDERGNRLVNAKALKLGRMGMSDIVWIGTPEQFHSASQNLGNALHAYDYREGFRYADFRPDVDTVAAVGVGAIAYKMLTGSNKKGVAAAGAGLLAVIVAFAKKLWLLIFVPFVFAWKWFKQLFQTNARN